MLGGVKGNALVMQSGGPTPVLNRSLAGVVREASVQLAIGEIYGARHGLDGLLRRDVIDLRRPSRSAWNRIARTPGAALGSTRHKLTSQELPTAIEALRTLGVRYLFIIGGNDSAETGQRIDAQSRQAGHDLAVVNVPKTIDNDLVLTDHCPGFGSAARFVALATMGAGRDAEAMGREAPITLIEVMGRDSGWLAASAALAKQDDRDPPHLVCVPEVPLYESRFLDRLEDTCSRYGYAVAVIAENARGPNGPLGGQTEPSYVDDFGHPYYDGPARYLAGLVSRRLKVRARYEKPGTIQRSFMACVSRVDADEAETTGRAAVRYAVGGSTGQIVTLIREPGPPYACKTGLAPLELVAGRAKSMPEHYLDPSNDFVTPAFIDYVRPLIGGPLPRLGRLE